MERQNILVNNHEIVIHSNNKTISLYPIVYNEFAHILVNERITNEQGTTEFENSVVNGYTINGIIIKAIQEEDGTIIWCFSVPK